MLFFDVLTVFRLIHLGRKHTEQAPNGRCVLPGIRLGQRSQIG